MLKKFFHNTNLVVKTGFTSMLLLVLAYSLFSLYQLREMSLSVGNTIAVDSKKIVHVVRMRDSIRQRQVALNQMLATDDPFQREALRLKFFQLAGIFRVEKDRLLKLPMPEQERELLTKILRQAVQTQKLNRDVVDLIIEDNHSPSAFSLLQTTHQYQNQLFDMLGDLIQLQDQHISEYVTSSHRQYQTTLKLSLLFAVLISLLAWLIARIASRIITQKNNELIEKNQQLEAASEQAMAATRTKSEFLAVMSHEIRTPLTSIIGFAEALNNPESSIEDKKEVTNIIIKNGKHLLKIINDILDISKIEANRMEFEQIEFSPVKLINEIEETFRPQFREKGIQFDVEYEFPIPNYVINDEMRVKQILINLVSNALKFTSKGKTTIRVRCDIDNEKIIFDVMDSGIGLTAEQKEKIFDAFTQADSSTTREYGGTGLGLSLSKQYAEKMGGTLGVESLPGIGSQFYVSFSTGKIDTQQLITGAPELPERHEQKKYQTDTSYRVKGNILVAEDNHDNQQLLSILLADTGAKLSFADNGKQALDRALYKTYDLILMDMQMPIMSGLEVTRALRQKGYTHPIVALTANAMKSDEDACIQAGCNNFLTKPVNREKLLQVIYKYLPIEDKVITGERSKTRSEKMKNLILRFESELPAKVEALLSLQSEKNWVRMQEEVHKIKGIGTSMGYPEITEIAAELEISIADENEVLIYRFMNQLKERVKEISVKNTRSE